MHTYRIYILSYTYLLTPCLSVTQFLTFLGSYFVFRLFEKLERGEVVLVFISLSPAWLLCILKMFSQSTCAYTLSPRHGQVLVSLYVYSKTKEILVFKNSSGPLRKTANDKKLISLSRIEPDKSDILSLNKVFCMILASCLKNIRSIIRD